MIILKSQEEIEIMRKGGKILACIMQKIKNFLKPGISTKQIEDFAHQLMQEYKVSSAFKGYRGFPGYICTSVNSEVVHGIPTDGCFLKEGDIISIDAGINYQGFYLDCAFTAAVGKVSSQKMKLIQVTKNSLYEGIKKAKAGNHLSDISYAIQNYVEQNGFSVVRDFVGHGIGRQLHEEPQIPNFGKPHEGPVLREGMVLAIEPMVNMGSWEVKFLENGWTAVTKDGLDSAHFEHTVALLDNNIEILTL